MWIHTAGTLNSIRSELGLLGSRRQVEQHRTRRAKRVKTPRSSPNTESSDVMAVLTMTWAVYGVTLILSGFVLLYFYMTRNFGYWKRRGIAEEKPLPIFGNFLPCLTFKKSGNEFFKDLYEKYEGERVVGFYLFDKPALVVRDIDLTNRIMVKDFQYFPNKYATSGDHDPLGSKSLFLITTPYWKPLRTKLTPFFSSGKLKHMFQLVVNVAQDLDSHFESFDLQDAGTVIELTETCAKYTVDVIATCAYGLKSNCLKNPDAEFRKYARKMFTFNYKRGFEFNAIFFAPSIVKPLKLMFFEKSGSRFMCKAFWHTLNQRLESGNSRNDLIDILIEMKKSQSQSENDDPNSFKFEGDNLTAQAAIFFSGGFKTTSVLLSFALYELALQPELQSRLREEVTSAFHENKGVFSYEWIMHLPYLEMVISETLRKYPVVGFMDRIAMVDYKVPDGDLVIEKGTPVFIPISGYHHDPEYYPEPEKFDPERFNSENRQKQPSRAYIPFGEGPRNCVGLRFGQMSAKLGLSKMIMNYNFAPCKETVIPPRLNMKSYFNEMDHELFLNVKKVPTPFVIEPCA